MSKSSRVSFSLAPLVHLYKRRIPLSEPPSPAQSPVFECMTPKNTIEPVHEPEPKPPLNLSICGFEQYRAEPEPSPLPPQPPPPLNLFGIGLSISVPKRLEIAEDDEVTAYDKSPLSPSAHRMFKAQRAHEKAACDEALAQALAHFHLSVTPPWQRTPASARSAATPSMSPLNLTPRPELPLLPMSPDNSFTGLDTLVPN